LILAGRRHAAVCRLPRTLSDSFPKSSAAALGRDATSNLLSSAPETGRSSFASRKLPDAIECSRPVADARTSAEDVRSEAIAARHTYIVYPRFPAFTVHRGAFATLIRWRRHQVHMLVSCVTDC
jgi:hypothetical protein